MQTVRPLIVLLSLTFGLLCVFVPTSAIRPCSTDLDCATVGSGVGFCTVWAEPYQSFTACDGSDGELNGPCLLTSYPDGPLQPTDALACPGTDWEGKALTCQNQDEFFICLTPQPVVVPPPAPSSTAAPVVTVIPSSTAANVNVEQSSAVVVEEPTASSTGAVDVAVASSSSAADVPAVQSSSAVSAVMESSSAAGVVVVSEPSSTAANVIVIASSTADVAVPPAAISTGVVVPPASTSTGGGVIVVPSTFSSTGPASNNGHGSRCRNHADCHGRKCSIFTKTCGSWFPPGLDCKINGKSYCGAGKGCFFGLCFPLRPTRTCSPACNADNGEVCNMRTGVCSVSEKPVCRSGCFNGKGHCVPSMFAGQGLQPICRRRLQSTGCGKLCKKLSVSLLRSLVNCGEDLLTYTTILTPAQTTLLVRRGALTAQSGVLSEVSASAVTAGLNSLVFSVARKVAAGAIKVSNGLKLNLLRGGVSSTTPRGQLLLESGSTIVSPIVVSSSGSLTVSLASSGTAAFGARTFANISSISLGGALNFVGDSSTFLVLPYTSGVTSGSGVMRMSGGLNIQGNFGKLTLAIAAPSSNSSAALINIATTGSLVSTGSIIGVGGRIIVQGSASLSGDVEPTLEIAGKSAKVTIGVDSGSDDTNLGNVTFSGSQPSGGLFIIQGDGSNLFLKSLDTCPPSATIRLLVSGSATVALKRTASVAAPLAVFNYGVDTFDRSSSFLCSIEVCGSSGSCVSIVNPNVASSSGVPQTGRRLFDLTAGIFEATWEPTSLTIAQATEASALQADALGTPVEESGLPTTSAASSTISGSMILSLFLFAIVAIIM